MDSSLSTGAAQQPTDGGQSVGQQTKLRLLQRGSLPILPEEERKFRPDIYWYLSFRCNLACEHCSVHSSPWVDTSKDLSTADALKVVDQMAELNVQTAILTGGEVLIRPDVCEIIRALTDRGISVAIETNGLRFTPEFLALARELQGKNKKSLGMSISLDGGTAETHERLRGPGSFERTVRNFHLLAENNVRFNVQAILNRSNILSIPDLFAIAKELRPHLNLLLFGFLNAVGRGTTLIHQLGLRTEDYNTLFELIKQGMDRTRVPTVVKSPPATVPPRYLGVLFNHPSTTPSFSCQFPLLGVLPNGDITICAVSRENEGVHFGNVRTENLKEVWAKTRMDMLRSRYLAADDLKGICGDCIFKRMCKGACRAWAYEMGEDFDSPFPVCAQMEAEGRFPTAYRISSQNEALMKQVAAESASCGACACSH
ncbi:MAG TPA: radical SAM protein [Thermoanaerobaculia bacterium]|jgi:radical SAM protein with 4Fe4S-binding SPASM domain